MVAENEIYGKIGCGTNAAVSGILVRRLVARSLAITFIVMMPWLLPQAAQAGFQTPESLVRNVYAWYGDSSPGLAEGLPRDPDTARRFFDPSLLRLWSTAKSPPYDFFVQSKTWKIGAVSIAILRKEFDRTYVAVNFKNRDKPVTLNFIVVKDRDGWLIYDVETPHDSLRLFLSQFRN
ncbi:hypothetical protein BH10PSE10_BH10PSE10_07240 [soil metagenome]